MTLDSLLPMVITGAQVIFINVALSGDNAIVIGMAAAGLPARLRAPAILYGTIAAAVLRIVFAALAERMLGIVGLTLAGGLLLLWVCWKLWRELREREDPEDEAHVHRPDKTLRQAVGQIVVADVSMSLDNVLAVAGAARGHPVALVLGLTLSVLLMAFAAGLISRLLLRWPWLGYVGLMVILYVAIQMIAAGGVETAAAMQHAGFWPF